MITVITCWYNEEFLSNLFLSHYSFADKIIILLDENNNDNTLNIINKNNNIEIKTLKMPDGMDDQLKQDQINNEYKTINDGWVIIADADEFIYLPEQGMSSYLKNIKEDVVKIDYFQMYQHKNENPLNQVTPVFEQRRYGIRNGLDRWIKPAIARANIGIKWTVGHHEISTLNIHPIPLFGAHWAMADIDLAINRRISGRKNRMSQNNYNYRYSNHNFRITEEEIETICQKNNNCPLVF